MSDVKYVSINKIETVTVVREEAETTITTNRVDDYITIYSSDNVMITKIAKAALNNPEGWLCWEAGRDSNNRVTGYFFKAPKKALCFRSGTRKERVFTEEQKEAAKLRLVGVKRGRRRKLG